MRKLTLLLLIAISCGFYTGVRAQVNVTSVSEKNDADPVIIQRPGIPKIRVFQQE